MYVFNSIYIIILNGRILGAIPGSFAFYYKIGQSTVIILCIHLCLINVYILMLTLLIRKDQILNQCNGTDIDLSALNILNHCIPLKILIRKIILMV